MEIALDNLSERVRSLVIDTSANLNQAMNQIIDSEVESERLDESSEDETRSELLRNLSGFGFLQPYLDDDRIEEVWINKPGELWIAQSGQHFRIEHVFSETELRSIVERMIRSSGRRLDRSTPFVDAQLSNGFRLHAVIPDITKNHLGLNIRKFSNHILTLDSLVRRNVLSDVEAQFLIRELKSGANILISGATQAGKTTLLSALLGALEPTERVVSVEDTFELRCLLPDWIAMQTRPASLEGKFEIDLRRLVKESLRMRPTRLVVGEVRGAESLDMLIALNSGIPGMSTIHANSNEEALTKIGTLPLLAGGNISPVFLESLIKTSMQLFVHCKRNPDGSRRVSSIMKIAPGSQLCLEPVLL